MRKRACVSRSRYEFIGLRGFRRVHYWNLSKEKGKSVTIPRFFMNLNQLLDQQAISSQIGGELGWVSQIGNGMGAESQIEGGLGWASQIGDGMGAAAQIGGGLGWASQIGDGMGAASQIGGGHGGATLIGDGMGATSQIGGGYGGASQITGRHRGASQIRGRHRGASQKGGGHGGASLIGGRHRGASRIGGRHRGISQIGGGHGGASQIGGRHRGASQIEGHGGAKQIGDGMGATSQIGGHRGASQIEGRHRGASQIGGGLGASSQIEEALGALPDISAFGAKENSQLTRTSMAPTITRRFRTHFDKPRTRGRRSVDFSLTGNNFKIEFDIKFSPQTRDEKISSLNSIPYQFDNLAMSPIAIINKHKRNRNSGHDEIKNQRTFNITFQTDGFSYSGRHLDYISINEHTLMSESVGLIVFEDPISSETKVYVRAYDSDGELCTPSCLVPKSTYKECSGLIKIMSDFPRIYVDSFNDAFELEMTPFLRFVCVNYGHLFFILVMSFICHSITVVKK
ncbi:unnamed protein product [Mytilus coruscus]|uniref:Uncharacterized protein n=1 Tax=Mytilus coruscus TaxID=42192 RepID=A0A6J8ERK5_MYTCO|nr:unnamed protein product [Mytilus coruscus]